MDTRRANVLPGRMKGLRRIHAVLGGVLVIAGAMKLYDSLAATQADDLRALLQLTFSQAEIIGGLWLLSGFHVEATHPWITAAFVGFWLSTLYQALIGSCSCGCFGHLVVNPWIVLVADLAVIGVLLYWRPSQGSSELPSHPSPHPLVLSLVPVFIILAASWQAALITVTGTATFRSQPIKRTSLDLSADGIGMKVDTDHSGYFVLPPLRPGHYGISLTRRSQLLGQQPSHEMKNPQTALAGKRSRPQNKSRILWSAREIRPAEDVATVWIEVSDCIGGDVSIDFK